jgi:nitroimidazol reductase NimA-like FMN-containing flavoprotein (pyridoxamine 5'-phosphate oxidase superfamily)
MSDQGGTNMQDIHQLKETIKALLDSQRLAVLATQGEVRPYGSLPGLR